MIIDLIRHGEPVGGRRYRGQTDDPLSETGWRQMRSSVGDACHWSRIVTSPLQRCEAFARELAARHNLQIEAEPRFREIGFGIWEGRSAQELLEENPHCLKDFYRDPVASRPQNAEFLQAFHDRVMAGWRDMLVRHRDHDVLVVCHAGVMRMIISQVLGMPIPHMFRIEVPNAGISRIRWEPEHASRPEPQLLFHGLRHFPDDGGA